MVAQGEEKEAQGKYECRGEGTICLEVNGQQHRSHLKVGKDADVPLAASDIGSPAPTSTCSFFS